MRLFLTTILAASFPVGLAMAEEETRQLDAHVHGESKLGIAFEGNIVSMELEAPAADIVGFEYEPSTDEQKIAIENAKVILSNPLELFVLPSNAGCSVTNASVEHVFEEEHEEEHEEGHSEEAGHEEHEHEENHGKEAHHDDHEEGTHSEFRADYELNCTDPGQIRTIDFRFFEKFPNAESIDVQAIGGAGQSGFETERSSPSISLSGVTG